MASTKSKVTENVVRKLTALRAEDVKLYQTECADKPRHC